MNIRLPKSSGVKRGTDASAVFRRRHAPSTDSLPPPPYQLWINSSGQAFTLIELLTVVAIIIAITAMVIPALTGLNSTRNIDTAAYEVAGILQSARSYATANDTYVWVGFFEEDSSRSSASPAISGTGRIVISEVASADGTMIYSLGTSGSINPLRLIQINNLLKITGIHLKTAIAGDPVFPIGTGTGNNFNGRPAVNNAAAQIGDTTPPASQFPFQYPVKIPAKAQYSFSKIIEFNPRGEAWVNNQTYSLQPAMEIGLQSTHETIVDANNRNVVAIQMSGVAGNVTIFRR